MRRFTSAYATGCLERLFAVAAHGGEPDPLVREWLFEGILGSLRDEVPLDQALGLAGTGRRSARARLLASLRDVHLARAVDAMDLDGSSAPWDRCKRLAPLVREFEARTWRTYSYLERPPEDWPRWRRELFHAKLTGCALPQSTRGLHRVWGVVTRNPGFSCQQVDGSMALASFI